MNKTESIFIKNFHKWLNYNHWNETFFYEAKVVKGKLLNYKQSIPVHQLNSLNKCTNDANGLAYKISDFSPDKKPFDGFFGISSKGYFIIKWYNNKLFYIIPWQRLYNDMTKNKSLSEERAKTIAFKTGILK